MQNMSTQEFSIFVIPKPLKITEAESPRKVYVSPFYCL